MYTVQPISKDEIKYITAYWANADAAYLQSLGADISKMPDASSFESMLLKQISLAINEKPSYALIWFFEGKAIGHCNVNDVVFGKEANMHLHIWDRNNRRRGWAQYFLPLSIDMFFDHLKLKKLKCQPYALNSAPNKTLAKVGFKFVKKYRTIPGYLNFEQDVNLWEIER